MTPTCRNHTKRVAVLSLLVLAIATGCVTVNTKTAEEMSNGMLCELLGPKWVTKPAERDTIYKEIEKRDVQCANGQIVSRSPTPGSENIERPAAPTVPSTAEVCAEIDGASVIADDDTYLGEITNKYASDSIYNKYGSHGSQYASESIWNKYATYGSKYSSSSPWNKYSSSGPLIIKNGNVMGRLTINEHVDGAINPAILGAICFNTDRGNPT